MKADQFSQALGNIDEKYLREAEAYQKSSRRLLPWRAAAAVLAAVLVLGGVAFTAEAAEYQRAVAFFQEHSLSMEGLTRSEIKELYQDITTKRFTYEKTAEVLVSTVSGQIEGYQIPQEDPTAEQLADIFSLWDTWAQLREQEEMIGPGIIYDFESTYTTDDPDLRSTTIRKYFDGVLQWEKKLGQFRANALVAGPDHICVYDNGSFNNTYPKFSVLDFSGNILYIEYILPGNHRERIREALVTEDSVIILTIIDSEWIGFYEYDFSGNQLHFNQIDTRGIGLRNLVAISDGYLVQNYSTLNDEYARLLKLDKNGNPIATLTYGSDEYAYRIQDMIEYKGRIYLSCYQIPSYDPQGLQEISPILDQVDDWINCTSEELTPLVKAHYDAILLVCDPDSGEATTFYTVDSALGAELRISDDGTLLWDVEVVSNTYLSIATSSFTIGGISQVFEYRFDEAGTYLGHEDTGLLAEFRR